jgi:aminoglycoside phosphotransferase (APT) family kinase protein
VITQGLSQAALALRTRAEYRRRYRDPAFWQPYVDEVLRRHGLTAGGAAGGSGGTFPTFVVGAYVVKFFPKRFYGLECYRVERALHADVLGQLEEQVPRYVADGCLFDAPRWRWPYLVTTRLAGVSWSEAKLQGEAQHEVARQLGTLMRRIHELPCPPASVFSRDLLGELRATCSKRHRRWHMLPSHLVDQIDDYLAPPSADRRLLHADLHNDHVFVHGPNLVGVIDWGDALWTDPYYELPSLHFGTFGGDKGLLRTFLDGYGWQRSDDFVHRAMTMTVLHEFNPLAICRPDFGRFATLAEVAEFLWRL